jgi:tripartite-type tricarboxylate transporter receptor subunit TctC
VISPQRIPGYDVMTMEEAGMKGFTDEAWYGLLAPARARRRRSSRADRGMKKVMAMPEFRAQIEKVGARPSATRRPSSPRRSAARSSA